MMMLAALFIPCSVGCSCWWSDEQLLQRKLVSSCPAFVRQLLGGGAAGGEQRQCVLYSCSDCTAKPRRMCERCTSMCRVAHGSALCGCCLEVSALLGHAFAAWGVCCLAVESTYLQGTGERHACLLCRAT